MAVLIGNARIDENNKAYGGAAGDQTGKEVQTQNWYSYPWNVVLRPTDSSLAEKMAQAMEYACANDAIGYDQYQRTTLFAKVNALGWKPESVKAVTACETDCSALIAVCVNCGLGAATVSKDIYTGNEATALMATGKFQKLTDSKYISSSAYLKRGDVLLNTVHHTAMVLTNGSSAGTTTQVVANSATTTTATVSKTTTVQKEDFVTVKTWKNGSTEEPVYADTSKKVKIGSLNAYESCDCLGKIDGMYIVRYKVDGTEHYKVGVVAYAGGVA
jgi:hypothetical protein